MYWSLLWATSTVSLGILWEIVWNSPQQYPIRSCLGLSIYLPTSILVVMIAPGTLMLHPLCNCLQGASSLALKKVFRHRGKSDRGLRWDAVSELEVSTAAPNKLKRLMGCVAGINICWLRSVHFLMSLTPEAGVNGLMASYHVSLFLHLFPIGSPPFSLSSSILPFF